jgi:hypothetical protein
MWFLTAVLEWSLLELLNLADLDDLLDPDDLEETDFWEVFLFAVFLATPFGETTIFAAIAAEVIALANLADFLDEEDFLEDDLLDGEDLLEDDLLDDDLLDLECFLFLMLLGELLLDFSDFGLGTPVKNAIGLAKLKNCSSLVP